MGYALAIEAARRGARVLLVSGPGSLPAPNNVELVRVRSAAEMHTAVMAQAAQADIVIMAAAVADYTPRARRDGKIAKSDGDLALDLVPTRGRSARDHRVCRRARRAGGARAKEARGQEG
jgi:phosphopantothenoylcysteine decarboxylase/phosphopantothenate--cysteine ligase